MTLTPPVRLAALVLRMEHKDESRFMLTTLSTGLRLNCK